MSDSPHAVLGLSPQADEAAIRRRYLELVRQHPPDREPQRFAAIHQAYDSLRDPTRRIERLLFHYGRDDSLLGIQVELLDRVAHARVPTRTLLQLADQA